MSKLELWAKAIEKREGFFAPGENPKYPSGTLSWKNHNPGNIIFGGLAKSHGATTFYKHPTTGHEFAIFPTYEDGFAALCQLLENAATGKSSIYQPDWTLLQFFTKYSPIRDSKGNVIPNVGYAQNVADQVGVTIATKISALIDTPLEQKQYEIYSQRDPRWKDIKLGFGQTTIGGYGCFLTCLSMMVQKTPDVVNDILKKALAFSGDMIISEKAAVALGLHYAGKDYDINNMPNYSPSIKEVDMSPSPGKQQHFVLRVNDALGRSIIDPWTGQREAINKYPFVSYRLFKIGAEPVCTHCCPLHCT